MRVLLVIPTPFDDGRLGLEKVEWLSRPLVLTAVGSAVHVGNDVKVMGDDSKDGGE
jgi:hypothetical protein